MGNFSKEIHNKALVGSTAANKPNYEHGRMYSLPRINTEVQLSI
jgi:hypothetical protein